MKYRVVFHLKAEEEFIEAVWRYGIQQVGLDLDS